MVVIPDEEDGGFHAYVPAIPNRFTHGETREHTVAMVKGAATAGPHDYEGDADTQAHRRDGRGCRRAPRQLRRLR